MNERSDLTTAEIANLSLEMRCCYFLYPWNNAMTGTTVEEWARQIGFVAYETETSTVHSDTLTAIHEVNELMSFVKAEQNRWERILIAAVEGHDIDVQSWSKRESGLLQMVEERDEQIKRLKSKIQLAARNLMLLDDVLKIVNTTIHHKMRSPYRKNDAFDAERMRDVCDVVTAFRKEHNIVG